MELATDPEITSDNFRTIPTEKPTEGVGIVEAPRGTLTHHYCTDERGIVTKANLIVGTTNNYAPISMSIKQSRAIFYPQGQRGERGHAQPGRDGLPPLRSVLWLRHALSPGQDAAPGHDPQPPR